MKASTKRIMSMGLALVFFVGTLVLYSSFISSEYDEIQHLRGQIVSKTKIVQDQEAAIKQVQQLIADYQGVARLQDTLNMTLPAAENLPQAIGQIQGIAAANNLTIQSLNVEVLPFRVPPTGAVAGLAKGLGTLRVNVRLLGSYESLRAFMQTMETNIRIFNLFRADISQGAEPNKNVYLSALSIDTYYQQK